MDERKADAATAQNALRSEGKPHAWKPLDAEGRVYGRKLAGLFLLVAVFLGALGWLYLGQRKKSARVVAQRELGAIADLKLKQISDWREERLSDARLFARAGFAARDVKRLVDEPNSEAARAAVSQWLNLLKREERYDAAVVFDMRFEPRVAIPPSATEPAASVRRLVELALQTHDVAFSDLNRDRSNGPIHLDLAFPVFAESEQRRGEPIGVVLLKVDARRFLFPLIQSWPTPSETAETLLVEREGDEVVYLNDLRHRAGAALSLRLPLSSPELPAALVLRGDTNMVAGADYRGVPVVAEGRFIPGTAWAMVAKVDEGEIYAPLRRETLEALAVLGALLVASGSVVAWLWRGRGARFLERELAEREAHEREMERMNRLYAALSQVNQAVVRARSRDELLQEMCRVLVRFGGVQMAWVGWVDQSTMRVMPLAQCGDETGCLQRVEVFADERAGGGCLVGAAIRSGRPRISKDVAGDPEMVAWREAAAQSGWRSLAAFPIRQEGEIRGVLAVYAGQKDFFGAQEQALIEEAAGDVSFGLDFLLTAQRRKQAEEGLTQANADLERKVEERTAQLVEANGSLQAFANTAAHDLRSPLRGIMGFTSMVLEGGGAGLGAEERALLERARASAEQMGRLLDDLLEYSRMHEAQIRLEPIDLGQGVSEALALLEADIRGKNAVVSVVEPLPRVMGHAATIVVLVNNLVSNALKFVPAGVQPQIRIWAEQRGSSVRLWVEDNGIGVGREDLERVFGAFERLHGKGAYPGTGLGLAIVRKGAQRMGGQAGVESEMGRGSRFWVELKAADAARRGEQPQRH